MKQTSLCVSPGIEPTMLYELEELKKISNCCIRRYGLLSKSLKYNCFFFIGIPEGIILLEPKLNDSIILIALVAPTGLSPHLEKLSQ